MQEPARILIRGVNWLGDAVMTTPALQRLRERFPKAEIVQLTPAKLEKLWVGYPFFDGVISFETGEGIFSVAKKLREGRFDLGVVLPNSPRSALELFFGGIKERAGFGPGFRKIFLTRKINLPDTRFQMRKKSLAEIQRRIQTGEKEPVMPSGAHQLFHYLELVRALGGDPTPVAPRLFITPSEKLEVMKKWPVLNSTSGEDLPLIGINPGAEYGPAKRWPRDRFAEVIRQLGEDATFQFILFGGKNDKELCASISVEIGKFLPAHRIVDVSGQTSLRELCVLLSMCRLLITNDTGPMHLASAFGTPLVVPFGSTSPVLTGPGFPGNLKDELLVSSAPCSPCFLRECPIDFRCMNEISVDRVVKSVHKQLNSGRVVTL